MKNKIIKQYKNNKKEYAIIMFIEAATVAASMTLINI